MELKQGGKVHLYQETEYVKGIGFLKSESFTVINGKRKQMGGTWLEELTKDMNLTKGERAFYK